MPLQGLPVRTCLWADNAKDINELPRVNRQHKRVPLSGISHQIELAPNAHLLQGLGYNRPDFSQISLCRGTFQAYLGLQAACFPGLPASSSTSMLQSSHQSNLTSILREEDCKGALLEQACGIVLF